MPIIKGEWYDEHEVPFMADCYVHDDPFGGPRCSLRPHNTKRRTRPGDFPMMTDFGRIARAWDETLTAADRLAWSLEETTFRNRATDLVTPPAHLVFLNHNLPQLHANADRHMHFEPHWDYWLKDVRLLEIDTDFDKLRLDVTYTNLDMQSDTGTVHFHQVEPRYITTDLRTRYCFHAASHDLDTVKFHPINQVDEFWIPLPYHADPGAWIEIYVRYSGCYTDPEPPDEIHGYTTTLAPFFYMLQA